MAEALKLAPEAVRKIYERTTKAPRGRTLAALTDLLYSTYPDGNWRVAETPGPPEFGHAAELRRALPQGRENAEAALEELLAEMEPRSAHREWFPAFAALLRNMLKEGYTGDDVYTQRRKRARPKKPGAEPPGGAEGTPPAADDGTKPKKRRGRKDPDDDGS